MQACRGRGITREQLLTLSFQGLHHPTEKPILDKYGHVYQMMSSDTNHPVGERDRPRTPQHSINQG